MEACQVASIVQHVKGILTLSLVLSLFLAVGSTNTPVDEEFTENETVADDKTVYVADPTPVVLWHGMMDSCCSTYSMHTNLEMIQSVMPSVYVRSLMIGSTSIWDRIHSVFMDANKQVDMACKLIADDPKLQRGYHGVGISQGAQLLRAVAQRCPDPPMFILVSLGGQHQGVYGVEKLWYTPPLKFLGKHVSYWNIVRENIVVAQNWHDPIHHDQYVKRNTFIADINNERENHPEYRENLVKLKLLVLVKFANDDAVVPSESSWFGFYKQGQAKEIEEMEDSEIYLTDRIGLKELNMDMRIEKVLLGGRHLEFTRFTYINRIVKPYLTKTYWDNT